MDILIRYRQDIHSCLGFLQCTQTCWRDNRVYPIWPGDVFCTTEGSVASKGVAVEEMSEITFLTSCKGSDGSVDDGWVKLASEWVNFRKDKKVNDWFGFSHSHLFPLNVFINFNIKLWACVFSRNNPGIYSLHLAVSFSIWMCYSDLHPKNINTAKPFKHCQLAPIQDQGYKCQTPTGWPPLVCQGQVYLAPLLCLSTEVVKISSEWVWWNAWRPSKKNAGKTK